MGLSNVEDLVRVNLLVQRMLHVASADSDVSGLAWDQAWAFILYIEDSFKRHSGNCKSKTNQQSKLPSRYKMKSKENHNTVLDATN